MKNLCVIFTAIALYGCATSSNFNAPNNAPNVTSDQELFELEEQLKKEPKNLILKAYLARQRELMVRKHLDDAAIALAKDNSIEAEVELNKALIINPQSVGAKDGLRDVQLFRRHDSLLKEASEAMNANKTELAESKLKIILLENPSHNKAKNLLKDLRQSKDPLFLPSSLKTQLSKPISLEFKESSIKTIFELISRTSNINFIFDKDVKSDTKVTIFVRNTRVEDAMKIILLTNQLSQKVLSENSILIYPNTQQKNNEYQELMVRTFYLSNTDIKQMVSVIKTIVKTNDIIYDERLNMLTMRDTPDAIRLAEKLIAAQDRAEPEVMLELEVLEVSRNRMQELGVRLPEQVGFSALNAAGGSAGALTLDEWRSLDSSRIRATVTNPSLIFNLKRLDTDTNLLANPRVRVRNKEKAKVHIGEKVPVITTTSTANVGVSESVTYLDVGLKLDMEPSVYLEEEVAMKVGLEVSNILETINRASGTQTYRLGTRNTATTLRLKDGETQILAGLIQDEDRKSINKVPGISNIPLLGKLFSNTNSNHLKTEIVLLITPHIIRNITQPDADVSQFYSGTVEAVGAPLLLSPPVNSSASPFANPSQNLPPQGSRPTAVPFQIPGLPVPLPPPPQNLAPDASILPNVDGATGPGEAAQNSLVF